MAMEQDISNTENFDATQHAEELNSSITSPSTESPVKPTKMRNDYR